MKKEQMSDYQRKLMDKVEKLLLTLEDKKNYVLHYKNLQFYLEQGMKLTCMHRALEFEQKRWIEPYIWMIWNSERGQPATRFSAKQWKTCKTVLTFRSRAATREKNFVASPLYSRHIIFTKYMVRIDMHDSRLLLNKPVYVGLTIQDNSKIVM